MSRMTGPVAGPMLEEELLRMCAITDGAAGVSVYPEVEDKLELKVGDIVFATAELTKVDSDDKADYALPGTIEVGEDERLIVRLFPTKLWEQGWTQVKIVNVGPARIRYVSRTDVIDDDNLISSHYADEIGEVVESCGETLLKNRTFSKWMGGPVTLKDGTANPSFKLNRWKFIRAIIEKMATSLSINDWTTKGPSTDEIDKKSDEAKWLETEFLTPVLSEMTSTMASEEEKKKYQADVYPKAPTVMKYVAQMMDILVSPKGPSSCLSDSDPAPDIKDLAAEVTELKAMMKILVGTTNAIATQLKIREVVSQPAAKPAPKPLDPEGTIIDVPGDAHECAYHVMSVATRINDGTMSVVGVPPFVDDAVDGAKLALLMQVKAAHEANADEFEVFMGIKAEEVYKQVLEAKQEEITWPTEMHFTLHAVEHPEVELIIKALRHGKLSTTSTRKEGMPPARLVVFANWRPGHFDLFGLKGPSGTVKIAFTQTEAPAAGAAFDSLLAKLSSDRDREPMMSKLSNEDFKSTVLATLAANREVKILPAPAAKTTSKHSAPASSGGAFAKPGPPAGIFKKPSNVNWAPFLPVDPSPSLVPSPAQEDTVKQLQADLRAQKMELHVQAQLAHQARAQVQEMQARLKSQQAGAMVSGQAQDVGPPVDQYVDPSGAATAASLVTFAQEQIVRQLQADLQAQQKQVQAQAQLSLQARAQVQALQAKLQAQQSGARHGPKPGASAPAQPQGVSPLDMIINGSSAPKTGAQPVFIIWSDDSKKKIEKALNELDSDSFKAVQSTSKVDSGTDNAHHVVRALPQNAPAAQQLMTLLVAHGMQAEAFDPSCHTTVTAPSSGGFQQASRNKGKHQPGLAGKSKAGLSASIAKAGHSPSNRVQGQCDYYSADLHCWRGDDCRFACYNGPAKQ